MSDVFSFVCRFVQPKVCLRQTDAAASAGAKTKTAIAIVGLFLLFYILPLGVRPLIIPDEMRYAEMGREIVTTGDWIVPRLNGLRYFEKPILGHWLHAISISLLGENNVAVRLPSAVAVGISAIMLFFLVRRFTREISAAIIAASVLLTCLEVYGVGTFCVLDSIFSMFVTASLTVFFFASMEASSRKRTVLFIISGVACGLAFLTKGFLAFVLPAIVVIPFALWQHKLAESARGLLVMFVTSVLTAIPWSIMVHLREPDFWHYFFWIEHVERFVSPNEDQHRNPFWYFVPITLGGTLPWTPQIFTVIYRLRKIPWKDPLLSFAACWFLLPFLFFSACHGKLGTYILPCFPPLIVLFAIVLARESAAGMNKTFDGSGRASVAFIVAVGGVLVVTQTLIPAARIYRPYEIWKWLLLLIGLLTYAVLLIKVGRATTYTGKYTFSCLAPLLLMFCGQFAIPDQLIEDKAPGELLGRYKDRITENTILVSDNYLMSAVCWSYKRTDVSVLGRAGELAYGLEYNDSKQRQLDIEQFIELTRKSGGSVNVVLVTSTQRYAEYEQLLPKPVFQEIDSGFIFAEFSAVKPHAADTQAGILPK